MSRATRLGSLLPVIVLAATAGCGFHRVFGWRALVPSVVVASAVPAVLAMGVSGRRRPSPLWPSAVLTVVCWLVVVSATLFRAGATAGIVPTARTMNDAVSGLTDAGKSILTTILPAPADPKLLVLVHACVWLAAFAGAELALRTRAAVLPALPAVGAFGVAVLLGVRGPGSNIAVSAVLVATVALLVLLRSPARPPVRRGLTTGLPYLACLTLVAGLAGPHLAFTGSRKPFDPSTWVSPPNPVQPPSVNPLDQVSAWLQQPDKPLFTVRAAQGHNWRLAVLDQFDGATWSPTAHLARSGGRVPPAGGTPTTRLEQQVTIQALTGVWLPAADRPASVGNVTGDAGSTGGTVRDVAVDQDSGIVALPSPLQPGVGYQVVSQVPRYQVDQLQYAPAADDPAAAQHAVLPASPGGEPVPSLDTIRRLAREATAGSAFPFQQAVHLANWLRTNHTYDVNAVPGHSYRRLEFFLETRSGTSEHFATTFAVMARTLGLPSRVVVGFRPGIPQANTWQVRSGDVLVWPEVAFTGVGWVPFYPTPDHHAGQSAQAAAVPAGQPPERQEIDKKVAAASGDSGSSGKSGETPPASSAASGRLGPLPVPWWMAALTGAAVLLAGYCLVALLIPYRRRRRRRRARTAAGRILGAWAQTLERLRDAGLPRGGALTAEEVAAFGTATLGGPAGQHLPVLARLVNEAVFAGTEADHATADTAWHHCGAVERLVTQSLGRRKRIRLRLAPRSLRTVADS